MGGLCAAFRCCSATVVSNSAPYTRPAGGHSGATSHPWQGVGLIPARPQPLDSLHFPPPSQLSPYLCQPQLQWLESWPDNSASCSPPMPRAAHRGPCPRASWVGGFPPHSGWRLGSEPWLTTPTRSGFWPCYGVCARGSGSACAAQHSAGHLYRPTPRPGFTRRWLASSCSSRWLPGS